MTEIDPGFRFDNSYARELLGFFVPWKGEKVPEPRMLRFNHALAEELGLNAQALDSDLGARIFSGVDSPDGARPIAMVYAGHQFGGFSPQLGDGRALLIGEIIDRKGKRRDIHLKGSGKTPFSRSGDGKAVLGPVLREYLIGEAMHALGIPTTRALAAVTTGETIMRETPGQGAVLARVASSHLRVGTFQYFASRGESDKLRQLTEYAIARHNPELGGQPDRVLSLLKAVAARQADLVAQWIGVGFIHGVMNTDNMAISGETIDYGPCAFMDSYDAGAVFSSIDHQGRYAYGNQPVMAQWNLARFAEALLPLIDPDSDRAVVVATEVINAFPAEYQAAWLAVLRQKLGLKRELEGDLALANNLFDTIKDEDVDFTRLFRALAEAMRGDEAGYYALFNFREQAEPWLQNYLTRGQEERDAPDVRAEAMDRVNPVYIPRNHLVEAALKSAAGGDMDPFDRLLAVLRSPFERMEGQEEFETGPPPGSPPIVTYCGT